MSRRAERLAAEVVTSILSSEGIQKAAGTASPALLMAVALPLAEALVERDKFITKSARKTARAFQKQNRMLQAIAAPQAPTVSPMRLPARPRQVDFRPQDWRTVLEPASEPLRNGARHAAEAAEYTPDIPEGHAG